MAAETKTYNYDALGRLIDVQSTGSVNNGLTSQYQYDPAGNRTNVTVAGSSGANVRVIVVPLNGFTIIPIVGESAY